MYDDFTYETESRGFDVVVSVEDYSATKGYPATRWEPAEPAEIEIISGTVELDFTNGSFKRLFDDNANATTTLFDAVVEANEEDMLCEFETHLDAVAEEDAMEYALASRSCVQRDILM